MHLSMLHQKSTLRRLMIAVAMAGLILGLNGWWARRSEALRVEAANRAIARKNLVVIEWAWAFLMDLAPNSRIDIADGQFSLWGHRRLEALCKAGAGKGEIVAALEKYVDDLRALEAIAKSQEYRGRANRLGADEMQSLRLEAEIWLNEEKAR